MHQYVEPSVQVDSPVDGVLPCCLIRYVEAHVSSFAACRANCGGSLLAELVVQVGEDYTRALAREQIRGRPAKTLQPPLDARGRSCYQGDFAFDAHLGISLATRR